MRKYNNKYFEEKYKILFDKLIQKEGFINYIKKIRKEIGIPENGFDNTEELSYFFINKLAKKEKEALTFNAFLKAYAFEHKLQMVEKNKEELIDAFFKKGYIEGVGIVPMMFELGMIIEDHSNLFTQYELFKKNKYLSTLFPTVFKIAQKYWNVDLLDDHIILHYIEKYLFLREIGIKQYIKSRLSCNNCKYIGINTFSPERNHMKGQDEGPYSENYVFNENTVKMLSYHFNSAFLIIKPYANKKLILQYIEENWDNIKEHLIEKNAFYKQLDVHPSMIKKSNDEKNRLIYELNKYSKKELLKKYDCEGIFTGRGVYKESIISEILKNNYQIEMSPDAIKKTANRYAKSIKIKKEPKDIRDI